MSVRMSQSARHYKPAADSRMATLREIKGLEVQTSTSAQHLLIMERRVGAISSSIPDLCSSAFSVVLVLSKVR